MSTPLGVDILTTLLALRVMPYDRDYDEKTEGNFGHPIDGWYHWLVVEFCHPTAKQLKTVRALLAPSLRKLPIKDERWGTWKAQLAPFLLTDGGTVYTIRNWDQESEQ